MIVSPVCLVLAEPHAMVAAAVICAPTNEEAHWRAGPAALSMLQLRTNRLAPLPSPEYAAAFTTQKQNRRWSTRSRPATSWAIPRSSGPSWIDLVDRTGADELMVSSQDSFRSTTEWSLLALVAKLWR